MGGIPERRIARPISHYHPTDRNAMDDPCSISATCGVVMNAPESLRAALMAIFRHYARQMLQSKTSYQ